MISTKREAKCPSEEQVCCETNNNRDELQNKRDDKHPPSNAFQGCGYRKEIDIGLRVMDDDSFDARFGEFPWTVALLYTENIDNEKDKSLLVYHCGASLIHPKVVLTAMHCVIDSKVKGIVKMVLR